MRLHKLGFNTTLAFKAVIATIAKTYSLRVIKRFAGNSMG